MTATVQDGAAAGGSADAPSGSTEAFFVGGDGRYEPRPHARSPWSESLVAGRLVCGVMAREVENALPAEGFVPSRMTVDLFRPIPLRPMTIAAHTVRDGRRIRVVDVDASVDGVVVARASVLALRSGAADEEVAWTHTSHRPPDPDLVEPPVRTAPRHFGEVRRVTDPDDRRFAWFRETAPMVENSADSPFEVAAMAADWVSPFTNMGATRLHYINGDVTLYLSRLPVGPWIGFENIDRVVTDGVAVSTCALHDVTGRIGSASAAALPY